MLDGSAADRPLWTLARLACEIEVRGGLAQGDSVIISDMSQFDNVNRVRLQ